MDNNQNQNFEQQPFEQQTFEQMPVAPVSNGIGKSIAALVLGAHGLILSWLGLFLAPVIVPLVLSILGIILGALGRKQSRAATGNTNGMATSGLVLGIIGLCITGVFTACSCVLVILAAGSV
jgi:hypothetical protein